MILVYVSGNDRVHRKAEEGAVNGRDDEYTPNPKRFQEGP